jgi:ATP/maltotriose-dependent transcriptional regulator MalT
VLQALFLLGMAACYLNDVGGAADAAARCETLLQPDDPSQWGAWLADLRALIALLKGDYTAALTEVERGIHRYTDSPEQVNSGYLVNVRGLVLLAQGRTNEAAQEFVIAREGAADLRQLRLEGFAALNLAWTRLSEGDWIAAATMAREAADLLVANRVREAESAVALTAACEASGGDARLALLRKAVQESRGNPDLYQPSDKVLVNLVQAGNDADR